MPSGYLTVRTNESQEQPPISGQGKNPITLKRANTDEPRPSKKLKDDDDKENHAIDEDDETPPIVAALSNDGTAHPTSKQYLIYANTHPRMISKTARHWSLKYRKVLEHVDPDDYNVRSSSSSQESQSRALFRCTFTTISSPTANSR